MKVKFTTSVILDNGKCYCSGQEEEIKDKKLFRELIEAKYAVEIVEEVKVKKVKKTSSND